MAMSVRASMTGRMVSSPLGLSCKACCWLLLMFSKSRLTTDNHLDDEQCNGPTQSYNICQILSEFPRSNCSDPAENTEFSAINEEQCYRRRTESARQDAKESFLRARSSPWANYAAQCNADDLRLHRDDAHVSAGLITQIMVQI